MIEYIKNIRKLIGHERLLVAGASVIVYKDGKLLLQKRKDNECWGYHGGCIELGETVGETAKRELFEETGLTANKLELLGVFSGEELFYTYPNGDMVSIVDIVYLCEDYSGEITSETNETTDLQWFPFDELPENISPPVKPVLFQCVETLKERVKNRLIGDFSIEPVAAYRDFVDKQIRDSWAGPLIVSKGNLHDTRTHNGFAAVCNGEVVGYTLYHIADNGCEITVLESLHEGRGVGSALVNTVIHEAKEAGCDRVWLITTNDNTHAIRFYQRIGFALRGVRINAIEKARTLKPQIPMTGNEDIPIAHEFEFELSLK